MCAALAHRGPDDEGFHVMPGIALGTRRLSVLDLASGHQPIASEDGQVVVVFNGEISNHRELRDSLRTRGHVFRSTSDTEVLVHLYEERGIAMLEALGGMFAFALWDARRQRLLLARDRLGIKPLYFWEHDGLLTFGSELRALLTCGDFPRALSEPAIAEYLALGYVPQHSCIFAGARKLPPGHWLTWERPGHVELRRYWTPVGAERHQCREPELVEELQRLLRNAVASHVDADVPLGAFLSGGIDSSTVVAEMVRSGVRPVRTFTVGFDDPRHDESMRAQLVARALGTQHSALVLRPDAEAVIDDVIPMFDEPFADSCALAMLMIAQFARRTVKVVLSGDGGDELFAGYTRYAKVLRGRSLPGGMVRGLVRGVMRRAPQGLRGRNFLLNAARGVRGRYASTVAMALREDEGGVARPAVADHLESMDALLDPWFAQCASRDLVSEMSIVDLLTYLPGDILTMVDRTTMAVSLEARVPMLDHHLVEFAVSLPGDFKMRDGTGKWLLRKAIASSVPAEVLSWPKVGLSLPLDRWFRGPMRHRLGQLGARDGRVAEWVLPGAVDRIRTEHLRGRRDHAMLLWRLLALEGWLGALARGDLERAESRQRRSRRDHRWRARERLTLAAPTVLIPAGRPVALRLAPDRSR